MQEKKLKDAKVLKVSLTTSCTSILFLVWPWFSTDVNWQALSNPTCHQLGTIFKAQSHKQTGSSKSIERYLAAHLPGYASFYLLSVQRGGTKKEDVLRCWWYIRDCCLSVNWFDGRAKEAGGLGMYSVLHTETYKQIKGASTFHFQTQSEPQPSSSELKTTINSTKTDLFHFPFLHTVSSCIVQSVDMGKKKSQNSHNKKSM